VRWTGARAGGVTGGVAGGVTRGVTGGRASVSLLQPYITFFSDDPRRQGNQVKRRVVPTLLTSCAARVRTLRWTRK
jgi:hypothetical protein